ncbi:MAG: hypothetical protein FJZ01_09200 [Candidatus Sericytochromatia bacterium]|nr:hypothetical protein [Candidatus Tanganyikabacteria bacterium]
MRRSLGIGLAMAAIGGLAGCGKPVTASSAGSAAMPAQNGATVSAKAKVESGSASGWVGRKNLYMSLFASAFGNGRYGDADVRLDMIFGDRVRGTVGDTHVEFSNWNGQLHGNVGKYPVWATYYNGRVQAYNGATALNLTEFGSGMSGWVGHDSANVSWLGKLESIEKIAVIAVILTELAPPQR